MITLLALTTAVLGCESADRISRLAYLECLGRLERRVDAEMTQQWRAALARSGREDRENRGQNKPSMRQGLLESQRAWLRYREAECTMVSEQAAGGTGIGQFYAECFIELTRRRTEILRQRASGFASYSR